MYLRKHSTYFLFGNYKTMHFHLNEALHENGKLKH